MIELTRRRFLFGAGAAALSLTLSNIQFGFAQEGEGNVAQRTLSGLRANPGEG